MSDLNGRSGFDLDIDDQVRKEWLGEWVVIIMSTKPEGGEE